MIHWRSGTVREIGGARRGAVRLTVVVDGAGLPKELRQGCDHEVAWFSRAIADAFVAAGARVVYADRDEAAATSAASAAGNSALALKVDISDEASVEAGFAAASAAGFAVDVVIANAGIQLFGQDAKSLAVYHHHHDHDHDLHGGVVKPGLTIHGPAHVHGPNCKH